MSEIRDRAIHQLVNILVNYEADRDYSLSQSVDKILSIPELAVVDRKAELPAFPLATLKANQSCYEAMSEWMLKAGWVKEVKDD